MARAGTVIPRQFDRVADCGPLVIDMLHGTADTLVISFSSIGHDPARAPSPEFVGSATGQGRPALFVMDESRSWGHAPMFAATLRRAVDAIRNRQPIRRIVTVGQSMGGFCAIKAATILAADAVLAFGPQSRLDDPDDPRWSGWIARLGPNPDTPDLPQDAWTVLMHGMRDDSRQALRFPQRKGIDHILFHSLGHSGLCPELKAQGRMGGLIDALATGDRRRLIRLAAGAGGVRRQLPRYVE